MNLNEDVISGIVDKVVARLASVPAFRESITGDDNAPVTAGCESPDITAGEVGIFYDINAAVAAAKSAQEEFIQLSLEKRTEIIASIRDICTKNIEAFSRLAVEETGIGRYEDKLLKNRLAIQRTPGIEILTPTVYTGDNGMTLMELAPYGVIAAITPCTNPTETIISNVIGMVAAGNSVVINAHPSAKGVSVFLIRTINEAIIAAGGPKNVVTTVKEPTIATAQALMKHDDVRLLVVTGGGGVVKAAMQSGKKVIAAGPGNPPVVVDETADIPKAARDIVDGASFDNNIVCVLEKEIIAVQSIADELKENMKRCGAYEINAAQALSLVDIIIDSLPDGESHGMVNKDYVGKAARSILREIGVNAPEDTRLIITETDKDHPFVQMELLMPVIPIVRVSDVDEAIALAKEVEHGNNHTAVMHSRNVHSLHKMARVCNASIFVKNAPSYAGLGLGGQGYASFTIASPTGEGLTCAKHFARERRCSLAGYFRIT